MKKVLLFGLLSLLVSCNRSSNETSQISLKTPNRYELQSRLGLSSIPTDKKLCYALSVTAPDIPAMAACGEVTGVRTNFVAEGQELSLEVSKGSGRNFKLYAYYIDPSASCGEWSFAGADSSEWGDVYSAGSIANITLDEDQEYLTIQMQLASQSIGSTSSVASCQSSSTSSPGAAQLHAILYSNGDIVNPSLEKFSLDHSSPIIESFSMVQSVWTYLTNAYEVIFESEANGTSSVTVGAANVPSEVRSLTKKPDSGDYYGLLEDGQVVLVDTANGSYTVPTTCGFAICRVPEWIQSISAGNGSKLFALDHAGNLYEVQSTGAEPLLIDIVTLDPAIAQVSYH